MIKLMHLLLPIILLSVISCTSKSGRICQQKLNDSSEHRQSGINKQGFFQVTKIVDGDTFWIDNNTSEGLKIRLIGIDAPESRNVFKKKKQPYGVESKEFLTRLLDKNYVRLEFDIDSLDQYGRTLVYAYLENGKMVNEIIALTGNGLAMTITPNIKYAERFIKAQKYARDNSLGLWSIEISD